MPTIPDIIRKTPNNATCLFVNLKLMNQSQIIIKEPIQDKHPYSPGSGVPVNMKPVLPPEQGAAGIPDVVLT